jgi:lipid-A-disaccharide synthase-like uncharacterized protein
MFTVSRDGTVRRQQLAVLTLVIVFSALGASAVYFDRVGFAKIVFLAALQVTPFFVCIANRKMDYISMILGAEFVGYTLSPLLDFLIQSPMKELTLYHLKALDLLIWSTILILTLFYGGRLAIHSKPHKHEHFNLIPLSPWAAVALGGALVLSFAISSYVPKFFHEFFLSCQFLLTCFVFCIVVPKAPFLRHLLSSCVLVGVFYNFLIFTNLGFAINLLVIWILQAVLGREWKTLSRVLVLLISMVCLQVVKYDYRMEVNRNSAQSLGIWSRTQILVSILEQKFFGIPRTPAGVDTFSGALDRAHDESLERVIEWTPSRVPYWKGRSFLNFPYLLWPPSRGWNVWNEFGHKYGYLSADDHVTLVLFSYFAEGYMNFGRIGIFLIALFVGIFFVLVEKLSEYDSKGYYSFAFIAFLMPLLAYQTDLGSMLVRWLYVALVIIPLRLRRFLAQ